MIATHARQLRRKATTNGCTASPELWYHRCCNRHDRDYATGADETGKPITRAQADARLFACMVEARSGWPVTGAIVPAIYWLAVRLFGRKFWKRQRNNL
jgi:hypothetical protein